MATFGGDSLEVSAYRAGDDAGELSRYAVELAGLPRRGLRGMLASREGSLWIVEEADESTVFHVFAGVGGRVDTAGKAYLPAGRPGFWTCRGTGLCSCISKSWTGRRCAEGLGPPYGGPLIWKWYPVARGDSPTPRYSRRA